MMRSFLLLILYCLVAEVNSQQLYTRHYTIEDGLKGLEIYGIAVGPDNEVWIQSGIDHLVRYDGISMDYVSADSIGLNSYNTGMWVLDSTLIIMNEGGGSIITMQHGQFRQHPVDHNITGYFILDQKICFINKTTFEVYCFEDHFDSLMPYDMDIHRSFPDDFPDRENYFPYVFSYQQSDYHEIYVLYEKPFIVSMILNKLTRD